MTPVPLFLRRRLRAAVLSPLLVLAACTPPVPDTVSELELVIAGGRVLDPETGLDAIRHVGLRDGEIVAIEEDPLDDRLAEDGVRIDAAGLVVAPGFVDLHAHGQSPEANEYQVRDGVTTALELEWGYPRVAAWLESRAGRARIHYGASVSHGMVRTLALPELADRRDELDRELAGVAGLDDPLRALQGTLSDGFYLDLPDEAMEDLYTELERGIEEGALGVGMAHQYYPGASRREIFRVFQWAAHKEAPIYTHVRAMGIDAIQEVVANAAATGAPLHIVHVNSSSLAQLPEVLQLLAGARDHGVDVTTESYPYTAGSTSIQSAIFDPGWQEKLGISYQDVQWQDTGERLDRDSFEYYRESGGTVILHMMSDEMIDLAMSTPFVIVASDGMPYAPGAHPRSAGTYARVLGRYVRERGVLELPEAIRRMTLLPAQRLETIAPAMKKKGRIQVGCDADLVVFDPETVIDTATFEEDLSFSEGIRHVLVAGTPVVRDGETVPDVFPGRPVVGRYAPAGTE